MSSAAAYFCGNWISTSELRIPVGDLGFTVGATVTERLRTFRHEPFRLEEHLARFKRSLEIIGLDAAAITDEVRQAIAEFLRRNGALCDPADDWSIIAFATPGSSGSGRPTVCVHGFPLPFHSWADQFETGLAAVVSSHRQVPSNCWPAELKCRSRMHYFLADLEAAARRPGARAILLDQDGNVAEGTTANVVMYRASEGLISPTYEHILAGVSLAVLRELAEQLKIPFVLRPFAPEELLAADEVVLVSTSICVLPIVECDGHSIGAGQPGPIYRRLLTAWGELVGVDIATQAKQFAQRQ